MILTSFRTLFPLLAATPRSRVRWRGASRPPPPGGARSFGAPTRRGLKEGFIAIAAITFGMSGTEAGGEHTGAGKFCLEPKPPGHFNRGRRGSQNSDLSEPESEPGPEPPKILSTQHPWLEFY